LVRDVHGKIAVGQVRIGFDGDKVVDVVWVGLIEIAPPAGADYDTEFRFSMRAIFSPRCSLLLQSKQTWTYYGSGKNFDFHVILCDKTLPKEQSKEVVKYV
jgi:hypothetical protein